MGKKVNIKWVNKETRVLEASLKWTNKKGGLWFLLMSVRNANCEECPFKEDPRCVRWWKKNRPKVYLSLCSLLWDLPGDNKFKGRSEIVCWQPIGEVKRKNRKD